jgi:LmbE family N-acetylglucosaminyl deacetylase
MWVRLRCLFFLNVFAFSLTAFQPNVTHADAISVKEALDRLCVTGSVLMIAAHPDDENTALISYLARGRHARTAYLSLTRGEGGQNVIGPESGPELGIIRTQELLQSRRVDGAQQFFTRAIDFGYSKNATEAIEKWGHDAALGDIVWVIRKFQPDVIVLQFTGTPADGHGQHQASSILGREAFKAAGDPQRFPEQLKYVRPWKATRLMENRRGFTPEMRKQINALPHKLDIDLGAYDPLLGYSYGELAGISRSFNRSQSDGTPRIRGVNTTVLITLEGLVATKDLFDGIDSSWTRYKGGAPVASILEQAASEWRPERPWDQIPRLSQARTLARKIDDPSVQDKVQEIDETIAKCAGLWLDFTANVQEAISDRPITLRVSAIRRTEIPVTLLSLSLSGAEFKGFHETALVENTPVSFETQQMVDAGTRYTQPYWLLSPPEHNRYRVSDVHLTGLAENPAPIRLAATARIADALVTLERPVLYRYLDRFTGESITPLAFIPPASLRILQPTLVFPNSETKAMQIEVTSHVDRANGTVRIDSPSHWQISPPSQEFSLKQAGEQQLLTFRVTPSNSAEAGMLKAAISINGKTIDVAVRKISYSHIPLQTLFPPAEAQIVRTTAVTLVQRVGYVMGSGDEVPDAVRQLGCQVTLLGPNELSRGDLSQFDAIVTGIRAYTERPDLVANQPRLLEYVSKGGTLIVQYNRIERGADQVLERLGPYPFEIGHERVTVEESPVQFQASYPLLNSPNKITEKDFSGWVQERGLYFASKWDPHYSTPFQTNDPGESPLKGATLVAEYGKGVYIFTALSWFRELPAGVPGAYRIFANFLSASKTLQAGAQPPSVKSASTSKAQ